MKMAKYVFLEQKRESCHSHKLAYIFLSLFVVTVMLLFCLTTRVDLLPTHGVHSLSRLLGLSALFSWQTAIVGIGSVAMELLAVGIPLLESESEASKLSKLINTLTRLYLLLEVSRLILSVSLDTLTTQALLVCANL